MKYFLLISLGWCGLAWAAPAAEPPRAADVAEVLAAYGNLTGKTVLAENRVIGQIPFDLSPVSGDEKPAAITRIEKALFLNGFTLVDADKDTVEVLGLGTSPRLVGLPLYSKPDELPRGERVFSYVFKLEHRDAREVAGLLQQFIPPSNDVSFSADMNSHTLLVTARTTVVRNLLRLMPTLDVPAHPAADAMREDEETVRSFPVPRLPNNTLAAPPVSRGNYLLTLTFSDMDQPPIAYKTVFTPGKIQFSPSGQDLDFTVLAEPRGDDGFVLDYTLRLTTPNKSGEKHPRPETYAARLNVAPGKTVPLVQSPDKTISLRIEPTDAAGAPAK